MANVTLTIPDDKIDRVATALCETAGLPVSNANAKVALIDYIKGTTLGYESKASAEALKVAQDDAISNYQTSIQAIDTDVQAINIT